MKDSSVGPVGLFDTRRQKRLLDGLAERFQTCVNQQRLLRGEHKAQREQEERELDAMRADTTARCRATRREMLGQWDDAEENLTSKYERTATEKREEYSRLSVKYRRKMAEEKQTIERKVEARRQAVLEQYENSKNQPGLQKRKEHKQIEEALKPIVEDSEWAREVTIRRLDRLPEVQPASSPEDDFRQPTPDSLQSTITTIDALHRQCREVVEEMQKGAASRIVDSYFLPVSTVILAVGWAMVAFFVAPDPRWVWMVAGIIPAGILGFVVYLIMLWPLKRLTRRLYPKLERLGQSAEECANQGRKISAQAAADFSAQLLRRRDTQLEATNQWQVEQFEKLEARLKTEQEVMRTKMIADLEATDKNYVETYARVGQEMRAKADDVATNISKELESVNQMLDTRRAESAARRNGELQRIANRMKEGIGRGLQRIAVSSDLVASRFPDWQEVLSTSQTSNDNVEFLPLGFLRVDQSLNQLLHNQSDRNEPGKPTNGKGVFGDDDAGALLSDAQIPPELPVVMHRRRHSGVIIQCSAAQLDRAIDLTHQLLWRLLTGAPPSRVKLTLIDPLGRGQHFTSFMALADHDPSLVGHRVWTTDAKIESRLGELAHHVEDVLQASLRDRFERIEDYNEVAGSMAEPYRAVAAVGFPDGLSRDGCRHLRALFESGLRCGIFTILVCDRQKPWPADMPLPDGDKVLQIEVDDEGHFCLKTDGLESLPLEPARSPAPALRTSLVEKVGTAAVAASRVEIPLDNVLSAAQEGKGSTDDGIEIVIGSQGANRTLRLDLGEGVRQHVLIAGKTGSGKSTLLHSLITSGAHRYRPDQLHFYLLDFKKGVEFKPYADTGLPHARVIGIESEREFGRSVLQRLDSELQQRGEKFRAAGVQELAEYRAVTGETMPRIMLVVDEFQELFVRDDRLAGDCTMLLDRLVRQGRSFGMHVVLSSQSLAGAYSLPRATLGQMAVRIAMQCSESDAALILSDDNTAARLISRPGEAIYNDAGGLVEGNQPFQVAWISSTRHREMLSAIAARDSAYRADLSPQVVFEGNRPCRWTPQLAAAAVESEEPALRGLLGEAVEIGPPLALKLSRDTGRNVLLITAAQSRAAILASTVSGLAKCDRRLEVVYFDGARADDGESAARWLGDAGISTKRVKPRDAEQQILALRELVKERGDDAEDVPPVLVIIDPLERFRDLRHDESFSFSLDSAGAASAAVALQDVLRDGPPANVFALLVCGSAETMSRWLPRPSQHDLELRIIGQMNQTDSSLLIDSPIASDLSAATMLLYDDSDGRAIKFRQCELADAQAVRQWLES